MFSAEQLAQIAAMIGPQIQAAVAPAMIGPQIRAAVAPKSTPNTAKPKASKSTVSATAGSIEADGSTILITIPIPSVWAKSKSGRSLVHDVKILPPKGTTGYGIFATLCYFE